MHKKYKLGVIVGRFEILHIGHEKLINKALELAEKVIILVTYSYYDSKNLFDFCYKKKLIENIYGEYIKRGILYIYEFEGIKNISADYGRKIIYKCYEKLRDFPDLIVYGSDKDIKKCFSKEELRKIKGVSIDRSKLSISSSEIRDMLKHDKTFEAMKYINDKNYIEIENISKIIKEKLP